MCIAAGFPIPSSSGGCLAVMGQERMAAGLPSSGCSVRLWRGKSLSFLILRRLRHQNHLRNPAPSSFLASWAKSTSWSDGCCEWSRRGCCCGAVLAAEDLQRGAGSRGLAEQRLLAGKMFRSVCVQAGCEQESVPVVHASLAAHHQETGSCCQWRELGWKLNFSSSKKLLFLEIVL